MEKTKQPDDDLCDTCGFPKNADRQMVLITNRLIGFARHLANKCPECGHYEDGSTIKDKETRLEYGGPPKSNRKGGWYAEIQEGRLYDYRGSTIKVTEENTQTKEKGESVIFEYTKQPVVEGVFNRHRFKDMLANSTIEPLRNRNPS